MCALESALCCVTFSVLKEDTPDDVSSEVRAISVPPCGCVIIMQIVSPQNDLPSLSQIQIYLLLSSSRTMIHVWITQKYPSAHRPGGILIILSYDKTYWILRSPKIHVSTPLQVIVIL